MTLPAVQSDHSPEWHLAKIAEFTNAKLAIGEPSPHMTVVNALSRDMALRERLWRVGCYAVPYSLLTAEVLWTEFPERKSLIGFDGWLAAMWPGIHTRTERRAVRTPAKFSRSLTSYRQWLDSGEPEDLLAFRSDYDGWWRSVNRIEFVGRYIAIRIIEAIRRSEYLAGNPRPEMELPDIRSIGGDSPIRALTLFYPDNAPALLASDVPTVDFLARDLFATLAPRVPGLSYYVFAAMLCEYREAYEDRHQYPGRTLDQELAYQSSDKAAFWPQMGWATFRTRRTLFPHEVLGEIGNRWTGIRADLSHMLRDTGTVWSDLTMSYGAE